MWWLKNDRIAAEVSISGPVLRENIYFWSDILLSNVVIQRTKLCPSFFLLFCYLILYLLFMHKKEIWLLPWGKLCDGVAVALLGSARPRMRPACVRSTSGWRGLDYVTICPVCCPRGLQPGDITFNNERIRIFNHSPLYAFMVVHGHSLVLILDIDIMIVVIAFLFFWINTNIYRFNLFWFEKQTHMRDCDCNETNLLIT